MSERRRLHRFVVPPLEGPVTGGTLFNRELVRALRELGEDVEVLNGAWPAARTSGPSNLWVDSLFIDELPSIAAACSRTERVGLIAHFLPSLLEHPTLTPAQLKPGERAALNAAEQFLAPSENMAAVLRNLTSASRRIFVVEPGRFACGLAPKQELSGPVRAVIVANVVRNKGILPLLQALGEQACESDSFVLQVIGNRSLMPSYAAQCDSAVATTPLLERRVEWLGEQSPERVVELLQRCDVMVSGSTMESYGMALAEARTLGIPLLAVDGGNVRSWISRHAGGELVHSHAELATAFLELCRSRSLRRARSGAARRSAIGPRSWREAAETYLRLANPEALS